MPRGFPFLQPRNAESRQTAALGLVALVGPGEAAGARGRHVLVHLNKHRERGFYQNILKIYREISENICTYVNAL